MQEQLMGYPRMMPRWYPVKMNVVEDSAARRSAQSFPLPNRFFVNLAVHDDHHDTRYPERYRWTYHSVGAIHHEDAYLIDKFRRQRGIGQFRLSRWTGGWNIVSPSLSETQSVTNTVMNLMPRSGYSSDDRWRPLKCHVKILPICV